MREPDGDGPGARPGGPRVRGGPGATLGRRAPGPGAVAVPGRAIPRAPRDAAGRLALRAARASGTAAGRPGPSSGWSRSPPRAASRPCSRSPRDRRSCSSSERPSTGTACPWSTPGTCSAATGRRSSWRAGRPDERPSPVRDAMKTSARAVVIGGGVGGDVDRLLAFAARVGRRPARRARRPDQRVDVPLGGAGRPAPRLARPDQDDDAIGRPVPDARGRGRHAHRVARGRLAPPGLRAPADGGAGSPGGVGQDVRPAARAHLGRTRRARCSRRCRPTACWAPRTCPPTATSTPPSSRSPSPRGPAAGEWPSSTRTRVLGIDVRRGRVSRVGTDRAVMWTPRSWSTPGACSPGRSEPWSG